MAIDVEALLQPVTPDQPCGVNLDEVFDADFDQVRQLVAGSVGGEGMVVDPAAGDGAREADWRGVRDRCLKLLTKTKDVRVVAYLTLALLKLDGLNGLRDGLKLLRQMLERYWDGVHPALDSEDNNDPTQRLNAIASLSPAGTRGDVMRFSERLREVALCNSSRLGRYSLRDIAVATGQAQPADPDAPKLDPALIDAAFVETNPDDLAALAAAAEEAGRYTAELNEYLAAQVGTERSPNLHGFQSALAEVHAQLKRHLSRRSDTADSAESAQTAADPSNGNGAARGAGQRLTGEITSNRDVLAALEKISRYYEHNEKSSPVPLFVECAKRLVFKSFLDIYDTLTPDAVQQLRAISAAGEQPR
jgi:type VI secretion system protein ImpA